MLKGRDGNGMVPVLYCWRYHGNHHRLVPVRMRSCTRVNIVISADQRAFRALQHDDGITLIWCYCCYYDDSIWRACATQSLGPYRYYYTPSSLICLFVFHCSFQLTQENNYCPPTETHLHLLKNDSAIFQPASLIT